MRVSMTTKIRAASRSARHIETGSLVESERLASRPGVRRGPKKVLMYFNTHRLHLVNGFIQACKH
jgi:hypothetical protein